MEPASSSQGLKGKRKSLVSADELETYRTWLKEAKNLSSPVEIDGLRLEAIEDEDNLLEGRLTRDYEDIGFCHNDLSNAITITAYEYFCFNPISYDIANHFCELAANYHSDTTHILDYSLFTGEEERRSFISSYLDSTGNAASKEETERLLSDAEKATQSYLLGTMGNHLGSCEQDLVGLTRNMLGRDLISVV